MKKNKQWLSLILAMWLALIMSTLAIFILEYIIPFSKNTKNVEQSVSAYYYANSAIEQTLYNMSWAALWNESNILMPSGSTWFSVNMIANWKTMPPTWQWNSEFVDSNWKTDYNRIRIWEPIQIEVWYDTIDFTEFQINFRIPDLDGDWSNDETLSGWTLKIVNWQLSWQNDVLNATWSHVKADDINDTSPFVFVFKEQLWSKLDESEVEFNEFYTGNCEWTWSGCILKMSIINKLELDSNNTSVPYLEWKLESHNSIPLRYTIIDTTWKSYGFQKSLRVKIPQQTLNEALDFTVFQ